MHVMCPMHRRVHFLSTILHSYKEGQKYEGVGKECCAKSSGAIVDLQQVLACRWFKPPAPALQLVTKGIS
eukprot:m.148610 g.148610  ORF g.148610 m.148610 type:complete len:70 (-) comp17801_c0_seq19:93-302(-)